jgi:hypothetical protein
MAYTIREVLVELDKLVCRVDIELTKDNILTVTVPVKDPKTKTEVITAIEYRVGLEQTRFTAAPVLNAIKADLDATVVKPVEVEIIK